MPHVTVTICNIEFSQIFLFRILCCSRHYEIVCRISVENESNLKFLLRRKWNSNAIYALGTYPLSSGSDIVYFVYEDTL